MRLEEANALGEREFVERFGGVFEHSPWVAKRAWHKKPFGSLDALHAAMMQAVAEAKKEEQLALVRAHPELAGAEAKQGALTKDSSNEQARLGLLQLTKGELEAMARLNQRYREKHGFPCIVALRLHATRESVLAEMSRRIERESQAEFRAALEQIGHITRGRLEKIVGG
ncbi:MAG TPA: 2-oxo-4-hydroxy-4-carboxy-5-ureidoimidazoline decarboxylase [Burkholderiales bacterium]|nr:2-oxo-4-hydroxy-4-carboxy-5-ureidoimidazoline decarboxylase [Burkholderiales bacterium]